MFDRFKQHVNEHKVPYLIGAGVGIAGITYAITRGVTSQPIGHGISVTAQDGISVLGKKVVMSNVSYISANRQGPPSWVTRCLESGEIYSSQALAAMHEKVDPSYLSKHLNGLMENANGKHFERICMAA
jgi:hypothetical protein